MEKIKVVPSKFVQNTVYLKGKPISLNERDYLIPIYDGGYNFIVLKTGRQCEKSTTLCNIIIANSCVIPMFNSLYITCTRPQAKDFSDQKLEPILSGSPRIQKFYIGTKLRYRQNVFFKRFINLSTVKLRYAITRYNIFQGLSADLNAIDELQDVPSYIISLVNETLSHSDYRLKLYAGTPKGADNTLEYYWDISTQNDWWIYCTHCGLWNYIDAKNIGKKHLICRKCGKRIYPQNGTWVSGNPDSYIQGFRLPQLVVPWKQDFFAWQDMLLTMEQYSDQEVHNLILALAYGIGTKPITEYELRKVCLGPFMDRPAPEIVHYNKIAGIDWGTGIVGKADSTLTIMLPITPTDYRYIYAKRYRGGEWIDATKVVEDMIQIINIFGVDIVCADAGFGHVQNRMLRNELGYERVYPIYISGTQKAKIKWNKEVKAITINKTSYLSEFFNEISKGRMIFPIWGKFETFAKEILAEHIEVDSKAGRMYFDHNPKNNDDYLFAALFAKIGGDIFFRKT